MADVALLDVPQDIPAEVPQAKRRKNLSSKPKTSQESSSQDAPPVAESDAPRKRKGRQVQDEEDGDVKRAIEASLAEAHKQGPSLLSYLVSWPFA